MNVLRDLPHFRILFFQKQVYVFSFLVFLAACRSIQTPKSESTEQPILYTIEQAKRLPLNTMVQVQGTVTVNPGNFASSTPYGYAIQDRSSGIYIVDSVQQNQIKRGLHMRVTGALQDFQGMRYIKKTSGTILGKGKEVKGIYLKTGFVNKNSEGRIIHTSGRIDSLKNDMPYGFKIFINDGTGALTVFINTATGWISNAKELSIGDRLSVTGLSASYNGIMEIEPRDFDDLKVFSKD